MTDNTHGIDPLGSKEQTELDEILEDYGIVVNEFESWYPETISNFKRAILSWHDTAVAERERLARLKEIALMGRTLGEDVKGETWKDWSYRALHYLEGRKAELEALNQPEGEK